jgi:hypothetical protein
MSGGSETANSGIRGGYSRRPASWIFVFAAVALLSIPTGVIAGDLDVGWISRHPEIPYVWGSLDPAREGWPVPGETVTWRAHVRNWHEESRLAVYRWRLDGRVVDYGWFRVAAGETAEIDLDWAWTFDRYSLTFEISPSVRHEEESHRNDSLTVFTDALAVGFWVEQSFHEFARRKMAEFDIGATSFEDWMQLVIRAFNDAAAIAIYPETPDGVLDRLRLQKVVVVPDGSLPLHPVDPEIAGPMPEESFDSRYPDIDDRTVDMQWGFPAKTVPWYEDDGLDSFLQSALIHELGHARYLVDVYGWWVVSDPPAYTIDIAPAPRRDVMGYLHHASIPGLMNQQWSWIDRHSAKALNLIAGQRATLGNYNGPENMGEYLNDLPTQNRVLITTRDGQPVRNARVRIYQASRPLEATLLYAASYDGAPDLTLETDGEGWIELGRNPFASGEPVIHDLDYSNATAIVQVETSDSTLYGYLESLWFNLAFWRGETEIAEHVLTVGGRVCSPISRPWPLSPILETNVESGEVVLEWLPVEDAERYEVWVSEDLSPPRLIGETTDTQFPVSVQGSAQWWVEAVFSDCPKTRSRMGRFSVDSVTHPVRRAARRVAPNR